MILHVKEKKKEEVYVKDGTLVLCVKNVDDFEKKQKLTYRYLKKNFFDAVQNSVEEHMKILNLGFIPEIKIRKMTSRWGSCAVNKKKITLNLSLVFVSREFTEYVVLHELLHFRYPGHNKEFYLAMSRYMPRWKEYRQMLKEVKDQII